DETLQNINKEIREIEKLNQLKFEIMLTKNDTEKELEKKVEKLKAQHKKDDK
ncbi:33684_t:CDS:2, partial [Gigaspora margarita]